MRTVHVSGGFSGTAIGDLTDSLAELATATFKVALLTEGTATPPAVGNAAWQTPTVDSQAAAAAVIARLIDNTTALGYYNLAIDVISAGGRHELAWAMDPDEPEHRALILVT